MKIHLIKRDTVEMYALKHMNSQRAFDEWLLKIRYAYWVNPESIYKTFPSADLLGNGSSRVVFDIGGNKFRLIGKYAFGEKQVHLFVCWIGTHAEYDKLCASNKQYHVMDY